MSLRTVTVILSDEELLGKGTPDNILRRSVKVFSPDGRVLISIDPFPGDGNQTPAVWLDNSLLRELLP